MIKKSRVFEFSKNSKNEQTGFIKPRFLSHMLPFLPVHALKMQHINMIASNKSCCILTRVYGADQVSVLVRDTT